MRFEDLVGAVKGIIDAKDFLMMRDESDSLLSLRESFLLPEK